MFKQPESLSQLSNPSIGMTVLELAWAAAMNSALAPRRALQYDHSSMLFHSPVFYDQIPITSSALDLDDNWIAASFKSSVLGEAKYSASKGLTCPALETQSKEYVNEFIIHSFLETCEAHCVYSGLLDTVIQDKTLDLSQKVLSLLSHEVIGNKENRKYLKSEDLRAKIETAYERKVPLLFIVPSFPFKDANPFRTSAPPSHVDFGEVALLIRLHSLGLALAQIYPYGVEWIIVSDGVVYAPIFDVDTNEATRYIKRIREYRNHLNLQNTIHILEMQQMVQRLDGFSQVYERIKERLQFLASESSLEDTLRTLIRGMRWNINTTQFRDSYSLQAIWDGLNAQEPANDPASREVFHLINEKSRKTAIEYASFNLTMKNLSVLETFFPSAIRATVHAKPGQVAIPRVGEVYPWNGVAFLESGPIAPPSVHSLPLHKILFKANVRPYFLYHGDFPFFFSVEQK